jgi:hypothetical protein
MEESNMRNCSICQYNTEDLCFINGEQAECAAGGVCEGFIARYTYAERVLRALKDDDRESLSFKDVNELTHEEIVQILPIAEAYSKWLMAVREKAREMYGDELARFEQPLSIDELSEGAEAFRKKLNSEKSNKVVTCKLCGTEMTWERPLWPGHWVESSCYLGDGWPICYECTVEYCVHTNCLGCEYGEYPNCDFLKLKVHYRNKE